MGKMKAWLVGQMPEDERGFSSSDKSLLGHAYQSKFFLFFRKSLIFCIKDSRPPFSHICYLYPLLQYLTQLSLHIQALSLPPPTRETLVKA